VLQPDLDLEADLGIDSIKRAEIVGELGQRMGRRTADDLLFEQLLALKTIREMQALLHTRGEPMRTPAPRDAAPGLPTVTAAISSASPLEVRRYLVGLADAETAKESVSLRGLRIAVLSDEIT